MSEELQEMVVSGLDQPQKLECPVCPPGIAWMLDSWPRRWLLGMKQIARCYCRKGMVVLEVGCGPSPVLLDLVQAVGPEGKVICADIQKEMLAYVHRKASKAGVLGQVDLHLCSQKELGVAAEVADFAMAVWMVHESPRPKELLEQIVQSIKPGGELLCVEPKMHVKESVFRQEIEWLEAAGMTVLQYPKMRLSRAVLLTRS